MSAFGSSALPRNSEANGGLTDHTPRWLMQDRHYSADLGLLVQPPLSLRVSRTVGARGENTAVAGHESSTLSHVAAAPKE